MGFLDHITLRGLNLYKQDAIVDSLLHFTSTICNRG